MNVGPDLDPNRGHYHRIVFLKDFLKKNVKRVSRRHQKHEKKPACRVYLFMVVLFAVTIEENMKPVQMRRFQRYEDGRNIQARKYD